MTVMQFMGLARRVLCAIGLVSLTAAMVTHHPVTSHELSQREHAELDLAAREASPNGEPAHPDLHAAHTQFNRALSQTRGVERAIQGQYARIAASTAGVDAGLLHERANLDWQIRSALANGATPQDVAGARDRITQIETTFTNANPNNAQSFRDLSGFEDLWINLSRGLGIAEDVLTQAQNEYLMEEHQGQPAASAGLAVPSFAATPSIGATGATVQYEALPNAPAAGQYQQLSLAQGAQQPVVYEALPADAPQALTQLPLPPPLNPANLPPLPPAGFTPNLPPPPSGQGGN